MLVDIGESGILGKSRRLKLRLAQPQRLVWLIQFVAVVWMLARITPEIRYLAGFSVLVWVIGILLLELLVSSRKSDCAQEVDVLEFEYQTGTMGADGKQSVQAKEV